MPAPISAEAAPPSRRRSARPRKRGFVGRPPRRGVRRAIGDDYAEVPPPEESEDFSWHDAFDVAAYWLDRVAPIPTYPEDLPPFLVRALQFGPARVTPGEIGAFYRRQTLHAPRTIRSRGFGRRFPEASA